MSSTPYQFIKRGNLFIIPVGPSIAEVPYPTQPFGKPKDYSIWAGGEIQEPTFQLDHARMPPSLYQEVRNDLVRYSPVEVTRSAFQRSDHAYVGVIDSKGTPYYFALDSRGISVREVPVNDDRVWKTFDRLAEKEHMMAVRKRRVDATTEMVNVDRELSEPSLALVIKAYSGVYKPTRHRSSWWRNLGHGKQAKQARQPKQAREPKAPKPSKEHRDAARTQAHLDNYEARLRGRQAIREKLRAEKKQAKPGKQEKPKASDERMKQWRAKYPGGSVEGMAAHPFAKAKKKRHVERTGPDAWRFKKALPKKSKEETVKKTPSSKASKKQVGAGGKPRYTYPNEKGGAKGRDQQVPLVVAADHDDSKHADPNELANQLGVSVRTLRHTAKRLGREGFSKFMRSHLKRFAAKHRLDPDYWGTLYAKLRETDKGFAGPF